jgi:prevent-host-death family protein
MSEHSVAETKNRLSELIDLAENGEEIVITRHGRAVARLTAVVPAARPMTDAELDRLKARRVGRGRPEEDSGTLVSRMRDEEWVERLLGR